MNEFLTEDMIIKLKNRIDEEIFKSITNAIDSANTCTSSTTYSEPFSEEKLLELIENVKPYNDNKPFPNYYMKYMPKFEPEIEEGDDFSFKHMHSYGIPVLKPTQAFVEKVQIRKHKCKRINKKWAKRYGYKEVKKEVPWYGYINCTGI